MTNGIPEQPTIPSATPATPATLATPPTTEPADPPTASPAAPSAEPPTTQSAAESASGAIPTLPAMPPAPPQPPVGQKRRLSPLAAGVLGLVVGAGIVGGVWAITAHSGPGDPGTFTLEGEFMLTDSVAPSGDDGCGGLDGYDDIQEGASVTVYGAAGDVVATGSLGDSTYDSDAYDCTFAVAVPDVPKGEKFYKVEVSHRGTVQMTAEEAESGLFGATLG
ncbi:hypothetical protein [Streptomyces sp. NPDC059786]|uniref:hypothetical protein n=1 Tax=Streptomyces sp. NPDC059786 TaxID=3346946 RepID=UPI0036477F04